MFSGLQVMRMRVLLAAGLIPFMSISMNRQASAQSTAPNEWTWMGGSITTGSFGIYGTEGTSAPENAPGGRSLPASWTDSKGNLWLFGGYGLDSTVNANYLNDMWEFSTATNEWTWMGGSATFPSIYSAGLGVYGTLGTPAPDNIPPGRDGAASWKDAKGNLWLFGGYSLSNSVQSGTFNDLWEFNPATNEWAWMGGANTPNQSGVYGTLGAAAAGNVPGARSMAVSWVDSKGIFWLFGGLGYDSAGNLSNLNDLWMFSPSTNKWTWISGSKTGGQRGTYGTLGSPADGNVPGGRNSAAGWIDAKDNLWLFSGANMPADLWEFNPTTKQWTWISGGNDDSYSNKGQPGVYGTLQVPAAANAPGSRLGGVTWTDGTGNLWVSGGVGLDSAGYQGLLNDLWEYNATSNEWAWMGGSATVPVDCPSIFNWCGQFDDLGTLRSPALGYAPGGRYDGAGWTDSKGNLWLFGGTGFDSVGTSGLLNDLWKFKLDAGGLPVAATPTISPGSGTYTSWQTVTISDTTPGATISYLINGIPPALAYTAPVTVSSSETIEAIASAGGYANSSIATASYVANLSQAATPTFSLPSGTYPVAQTLTIYDVTPGAAIYYAIGSLPATHFTPYTGPIAISSPETVQAFAVAEDYLQSATATTTFNIGLNPSAEWTWMGGSSEAHNDCLDLNVCPTPGWYGTMRTPASSNIPSGRAFAASWTGSNGNLWLFGGFGADSVGNAGDLNDLWEFSPSLGQWAWMSGNSTMPCTALGNCTTRPGVYGTKGTPAASNTPGSRESPAAWTDKAGHLWLFGGDGKDAAGNYGYLNDLWEFDPSTNQWAWMGGESTLSCVAANECSGQSGIYGSLREPAAENAPGGRTAPTIWTDPNGNFWIYGGHGMDSRGIGCYLNDLWKFTPSANQWTWMAGSQFCPAFEGGYPGYFDVVGIPEIGIFPWSLQSPASWADSSGRLWLFAGLGWDTTSSGYYLNDMWEFDPSLNEWAMTSSNSVSVAATGAGVYGAVGNWGPKNIPGERDVPANWTDSDGNFWLLGGLGVTPSANLGLSRLNDLWEFKPSLNEWAWMGGSSNGSPSGVYGTLGTAAQGNAPGGRSSAATWTDSSGNLWLFGGLGYDAKGATGYLSDLWQYGLKGAPSVHPAPPAAEPVFSLAAGTTYAAAQTLTISEQTPGATIYYTTDGTVPNSNSAVYQGQILVSSTETLQAIAIASGYAASALATATYTIDIPVNPAPVIGSLSPAFTSAGGAAFRLTVNGSGFTVNSTIYWGTTALATTYGSMTQLTAQVPAADITTAGIASVTVQTPAPGGGTSNSSQFEVDSAASGTVTPPSFTTVTATVTPGATASYPVTLPATASSISVKCLNLPTGASCSYSATTGAVTITTSSTSPAGTYQITVVFTETLPGAASGFVLLPFLLVPLLIARRKWNAGGISLMACLGLFLMVAAVCVGCGGGGGGGSSPVSQTHQVTSSSAVSLTIQ
jgi:N-acetylneuraminic acid mutarotase